MTVWQTVRRPRLRLTVNGMAAEGCMSADITSRRGSRATTYRVEVNSDALSAALGSGWSDLDTIDITVDMAFADSSMTLPAAWINMVSGTVDRVSFDPMSRLAVLDGRDHAAKLIDLPLQDAYLNKTCAEVVGDLAARCGLTADVDDTAGLIGQYYEIQHSKTVFGAYSRHANGWDLLAELAQIENYELWVDGNTLHFKKPVADSEPFVVNFQPAGAVASYPTLTASSMSLDRTIGISGPMQVQIDSWNSRQKQKVTASYPKSVSGDVKLFSVLKPNLLPDQAEALAQSTYLQLRARQRTVAMTLPGELTLTPRRTLRLSGTGTGWDADYVVDNVVRQMSLPHGFVQHISAVSNESEDDGDG